MEKSFQITNKTKGTLPKVPFEKMKNFALGEKYNLSLVFIGKETSKKLNHKYRGKNKETNILSFPLDKKNGEIFINLKLAHKQKENFDRKLANFVAFLFIHGLTHLKGMQHGSKMEKAEEVIRRKFRV